MPHKSTYSFFAPTAFEVPRLSGWERASDLMSADVLITSENDTKVLAEYLRAKPLHPVVNLGSAEAEITCTETSEASVVEAIFRASEILEHLNELPEAVLSHVVSDPYLMAAGFAWSRGRRVNLYFDGRATSGYRYALSNRCRDAEALLEQLAQSGYFDREIVDRLHPCPECESIKVVLRDTCPDCASVNIEDQPLIHHFSCSYQGAESAFTDAVGDYICPKCRKQLRHFGKDYDKPGEQTVCLSCGYEGYETHVRGRCLNCSHEFGIETASPKRFYEYFLNEAGVHALFRGEFDVYNPARLLAKQLRLLTIDQLVAIGQKFAAVEERHDFHSLLMEMDFSGLDAREATVSEKVALVTRIGRELAGIVRPTDSVAYHMGTILLLMPGANHQVAEKVVERLRMAVRDQVDPAIMDEFRFSSQSIVEFFSEHA